MRVIGQQGNGRYVVEHSRGIVQLVNIPLKVQSFRLHVEDVRHIHPLDQEERLTATATVKAFLDTEPRRSNTIISLACTCKNCPDDCGAEGGNEKDGGDKGSKGGDRGSSDTGRVLEQRAAESNARAAAEMASEVSARFAQGKASEKERDWANAKAKEAQDAWAGTIKPSQTSGDSTKSEGPSARRLLESGRRERQDMLSKLDNNGLTGMMARMKQEERDNGRDASTRAVTREIERLMKTRGMKVEKKSGADRNRREQRSRMRNRLYQSD